MSRSMRIVFGIILIAFLSNVCFGQSQSTGDEFWRALQGANKHYDKAAYHEAAAAYQSAFTLKEDQDYANHRLFAAAANCMIDNEIGVKDNLFALLPICTKRDMKKVLVNYEIFNKYKASDWWLELKSNMDERLASLIARHQNLHIFKKGRNLVYRATRINEAGDTLANTTVTMIPDGTGWGDEAATLQSQVIYEYDYTVQDSLDHINELIYVVEASFWKQYDTTGIIENENKIWIHPIRNNEFFKTEVAPFPKVAFPISQETIEKEKSKIYVLADWGTYTGSVTESEYYYIGEEVKKYGEIRELDCFKFKAQSFNNFHGISKIEYFFNSDLGFVEMNYLTYDNDKITFVLEEIVQK